jgi:hypothetical protein
MLIKKYNLTDTANSSNNATSKRRYFSTPWGEYKTPKQMTHPLLSQTSPTQEKEKDSFGKKLFKINHLYPSPSPNQKSSTQESR